MAKKKPEVKEKRDIYQEVTNTIVAQLEKGVRPWQKPWDSANIGGQLPLRVNGIPYKGTNVILLWLAALEKGYANPMWMTYKQSEALGGQVRKGEKGSPIVYSSSIKKKELNPSTGLEELRSIPFMKGHTVFNCEQIDGLPEKYYVTTEVTTTEKERLEHVDIFFQHVNPVVIHKGGRAFYSITGDYIQLPPFETFFEKEGYYATFAHETVHWTRHPTRLDRDFGRKKWGDEGYAREELVAEIGSAFLCATLGITPEVREDHVAYIESWLEVLKGDKKFIFTAASAAQKALEFMLKCQPGYVEATTEMEEAA